MSRGKKMFEEGKEGCRPARAAMDRKGWAIDANADPALADVGYAYLVKQATNFAEDQRTDMSARRDEPVCQAADRGRAAQRWPPISIRCRRRANPPTWQPSRPLETDVGEAYRGQILVRYGVIGKAAGVPVVPRV